MSYVQKDGQGSLFKNSDKKSDKHPDYSGTVTIEGKLYSLAAWIKESSSGKKYMSLSAQEKVVPAPEPRRQEDDFSPDSSLPF